MKNTYLLKSICLILGLVISADIYACPDLSGSYVDKKGESIILSQSECLEVTVLSRSINHTLTLDNQFTLIQDDEDIRAFGRGVFLLLELVLEAKVEYKKDQGIPPIFLPVRAINKYSKNPTGDLLEKSTIYNSTNGVLAITKTIYKKVVP
jgi:hypothetical protein